MQEEAVHGSMPFRIGTIIDTVIYGGPFVDCPTDMFGVNVAKEIDLPSRVAVPIVDFDTPYIDDLNEGILRVLMAAINGENIYVGCGWGRGRTGLFLAALAKVQREYILVHEQDNPEGGVNPVDYVREHYHPLAVETVPQQEFISMFDASPIIVWLEETMEIVWADTSKPIKEDNFEYDDTKSYADIGDWMDDPNADSATRGKEEDLQWLQAESLQSQIDELQDQIDDLWDEAARSIDAIATVFRAMFPLGTSLTKPTWYEKISSLFK